MGQALDWPTQVVFPAAIVAAAAQKEHPTLTRPHGSRAPAGSVSMPPRRKDLGTGPADDALLRADADRRNASTRWSCSGAARSTSGRASICFCACAAAVARLGPKRPVRFVWIGAGYQPEHDHSYSCYLADQIERSGLGAHDVDHRCRRRLEPAYALADVFFLSSRLDPLPNVTIDAALRAIPVVCFEGATGMADLLAADALAEPMRGALSRCRRGGQCDRQAGRRRARADRDRESDEARGPDDVRHGSVRASAGRTGNRRSTDHAPAQGRLRHVARRSAVRRERLPASRGARSRTRDEAITGSWRAGSPLACSAIRRRTVCSGARASAFTPRSTRTRTANATMPHASILSHTSFAAAGRMVRGVTR